MSPIINKKQMTEEDIKLNYITPAILPKWKDFITMETKITDGMVNLKGNLASRAKAQKVDYLLYHTDKNHPIAVIEAKDNKHSMSFGMQQAIDYATKLDLPFAYSSNGDGFWEHDMLTGKERQLTLEEFPTMDELINRYKAELNNGSGITPKEEAAMNQPYYSSQTTYPPRYYQRIAVNRTVDAIAKGQDRLLLVMATGTGKTYTAFQIVYRLLKSGMKKKILYLADRNNLVDQSIQQDFAPLSKTIHKVNFSKDDKKTINAYEVYFALYQQLIGNDDEEHFKEWFSPDFFDMIIVDECHRGSAKADSQWRKVLDYFNSATQIGMTATPRETSYVSNIDYFGDPIYTYSLKEGIQDGFLAPFKVINVTTNIGDGWRPYEGQRDVNGFEIEDRIYNNSDYDYNIIIQDRINQVAKEISDYLKSTGRMQKTIVFCANEDHAERMRIALVNENSDMTVKHPDYVVRITGSDEYGKSKLDYFISVSSDYPVIATTSELLSTGTDCKMTKLIVLDKTISSMTSFKQIIGRGTRIREKEGKLSFNVMDFRNVTRLFTDPNWDGPIKQDDEWPKKPGGGDEPVNPPVSPVDPPIEPKIKPFVDKNGCRVEVINKMVSIYDANGKLLKQENIIDYTKSNIIGEYANLQNFIRKWSGEAKKVVIDEALKEVGIDLQALKNDQGMSDVDDFDFICYVAYGKKPLTRRERAENVKKRDFFSKYSGDAREVLEILLEKYMNEGIYEIEKKEVLKLADFAKYGKPSKIAKLFGGTAGYEAAVKELEADLYEYEVG